MASGSSHGYSNAGLAGMTIRSVLAAVDGRWSRGGSRRGRRGSSHGQSPGRRRIADAVRGTGHDIRSCGPGGLGQQFARCVMERTTTPTPRPAGRRRPPWSTVSRRSTRTGTARGLPMLERLLRDPHRAGQPDQRRSLWGLLDNYQFTPVSGCQTEVNASDQVLWAYDAFNAVRFLRLSASTTTVAPGQQVTVTVHAGNTITLVSGATVAPVTTNAANGYETVDTGDHLRSRRTRPAMRRCRGRRRAGSG